MKRILLLLGIVMLSACATEANYTRNLNSWLGKSELDLVRKWGAPQQTYEADGHKFLSYSDSNDVFIPGGPTVYTANSGAVVANQPLQAQNLNLSCITTFEVANGVVANWTWKGNNCVSK